MNNAAWATFRAILAIWNGGPVDRLPELLAATYRGHVLGLDAAERDTGAYRSWIERYREANPGAWFEVVEQIDARDQLVTRLTARRANGAKDSFSGSHGINIAGFDQTGRLAEEWAIWSAWLDDEATHPAS